jgi:hypothetical protein
MHLRASLAASFSHVRLHCFEAMPLRQADNLKTPSALELMQINAVRSVTPKKRPPLYGRPAQFSQCIPRAFVL